jgi:hypothetical protein
MYSFRRRPVVAFDSDTGVSRHDLIHFVPRQWCHVVLPTRAPRRNGHVGRIRQ